MSGDQPASLGDVDPFDLPSWLVEAEVTWEPEGGIRRGHLVRGELHDADSSHRTPCDLLAVDEAYPRPVASDDVRLRAHQAWRHGEVLLLESHDEPGAVRRLVLAVPGTRFTADQVLDALSRLSRAVGSAPDRFAARLRIGVDSPQRPAAGR